MSNSNFVPMPFRRNFGDSNGDKTVDAPPPASISLLHGQSVSNQRDMTTGACRKCGYVGHLAFQCRNFIKLKPQHDLVLDVSSTSSESNDDNTPLVASVVKSKKSKKLKKPKKFKKDRHSLSENEKRDKKHNRKRKHKEEKVKKEKKRHRSSHSK